MNSSQRQQIWTAIQALGLDRQNEYRSHYLNHWRFSQNGDKAIFEAQFQDNELTVASFKNKLATIFSVDPATINSSTAFQTFATLQTRIVTFSRNATNYIRFVAFGDVTSTWDESHTEILAYLAANISEWEPVE